MWQPLLTRAFWCCWVSFFQPSPAPWMQECSSAPFKWTYNYKTCLCSTCIGLAQQKLSFIPLCYAFEGRRYISPLLLVVVLLVLLLLLIIRNAMTYSINDMLHLCNPVDIVSKVKVFQKSFLESLSSYSNLGERKISILIHAFSFFSILNIS